MANHVGLYRFGDDWLIATRGRTMDGLGVALDPIRIVPNEPKALAKALDSSLSTPPRLVGARPSSSKRGIYAEALGLASPGAFAKQARCFVVAERDGTLEVKEAVRDGRNAFRGTRGAGQRFSSSEQVAEYLVACLAGPLGK